MVRLLVGDARAELAALAAESVHCCVTSPPYWGLRNYNTTPQVWNGDEDCLHEWGEQEPHGRRGKRGISGTGGAYTSIRVQSLAGGGGGGGAWCQGCGAWRGELGAEPTPELFVEHLVGIFREVKRVLRADGTLFLNMGDCYASAWPCQRRNEVGLGSLPDGKRASRPSRLPGGLKEKDLVGVPWMLAFALRADGWYLRSDIIWAKGNPMPASVTDRPTTSHEYLFLLSKQPRYYYDATAIREPSKVKRTYPTWAQRKADGAAMRRGDPSQSGDRCHWSGIGGSGGTRNKRSVWTINTQASGIPHYATFPAALVRPCVLAGTSERGACSACGAPWERTVETSREPDPQAGKSALRGAGHMRESPGGPANREGRVFQRIASSTTTGWQPTCTCDAETVPCTVLDPFSGVGTTAAVAHLLGRDAVSIDLDPASLTHYPTRLAALSKLAKPKRVPQEQRTLPAMEDAP